MAERRRTQPKEAKRAGGRRSARSTASTGRKGRTKYVYGFGEGNREMRYLLGGKGANLAEMTNLDLPVPPGFTITTDACREFMKTGKLPGGLDGEVNTHLRSLERTMGRRLGDAADPLLVSVRSGSMFSMPGMMDTVLNLGMNDASVEGLAKQTGDDRYAWDCYRRFIQMFGKIVMGVPGYLFEEEFEERRDERARTLGASSSEVKDTDLEADDLEALVEAFKGIVKREAKRSFPQDPHQQLTMAVEAVFNSWNNKRADEYRRREGIDHSLGTAVNVQAMVFGNRGADSGTGVAFTRDPATGKKGAYGDYLPNAQGEDVVAGIRTPEPLDTLRGRDRKVYDELMRIMRRLEGHYRDMCDIEFTVEQGRLWMLQTRVGKRTALAAVRIAVGMVKERLITRADAIGRVTPDQVDQLLHPQFDPNAAYDAVVTGVNASPGAAVGKVVLDADTAVAWADAGEKVVLLRDETNPDDVHGMYAAEGILTARGGKTSHAAVVARGAGKPCVVGASGLRIDLVKRSVTVGGTTIKEGDLISLDGTTGNIVAGEVPLVVPEVAGEFGRLLGWADSHRKLGIRANADTPEDARRAREFGAAGIGLARTEHMFLGERLPIVRRAILARGNQERDEALEDLRALQREDFLGIFEAMDNRPVTIRLLDPPLHEFLPGAKELALEAERYRIAADVSGIETLRAEADRRERLLRSVEQMEETNPMMGLRGCRLGLIVPGIYQMQVRAIMQAACDLKREGGKPIVEIMIPLVGIEEELSQLRAEAEEVAKEVQRTAGVRVAYAIGTMIEVPRAALTAGSIAAHADFFSFGTNDLTQMTYAFSRDDAEGKVLVPYLERGVISESPFESIDREGVGRLVEIATAEGRKANSKMKVGVCGEHGGDPPSIAFFHEVGLDYVSCSPFRVPVARLAAAQAAIGAGTQSSR